MKDEEYLDEQFPKGDKRRGEAMVLLALARLEGINQGSVKTAKFIDECCDGIRDYSMNRVPKNSDFTMGMSNACASIEEECKFIKENKRLRNNKCE